MWELEPVLRSQDIIPNKINQVKKMAKGRHFSARQLTRILHTADIVPAYCYCMYCWTNVDMDHEPVEEPKRYEKQLCNRVFLPCQHMVACELCTVQIQHHKYRFNCIFCDKLIVESVPVDDKRIVAHDHAGPRARREFDRLDADGSGSLDREEVKLLIGGMLGNRTTLEDIEEALTKMDRDGTGEVERAEFVEWFRAEHADEQPAGPVVFRVQDRLDEMLRRKALPRPTAGDRELLLELSVALFGRCTDILQYKRVVHFFSNHERQQLYHRLGPLNAMNPMDPDGLWKIDLRMADERAIAQMLVHLAVHQPGECWKGEMFGRVAPANKNKVGWHNVNLRELYLPRSWVDKVPHEGFLELVHFTPSYHDEYHNAAAMIACRRALIPRCLVSDEYSDLSKLANRVANQRRRARASKLNKAGDGGKKEEAVK
eukprot:SAG11_NODE_77_length_17985_cov_25.875657_15_plen_429_part_00